MRIDLSRTLSLSLYIYIYIYISIRILLTHISRLSKRFKQFLSKELTSYIFRTVTHLSRARPDPGFSFRNMSSVNGRNASIQTASMPPALILLSLLSHRLLHCLCASMYSYALTVHRFFQTLSNSMFRQHSGETRLNFRRNSGRAC